MAEQNSGFSNLLGQSGIVNYPLLGLVPNIMSRGYQYQAQPTYYQRDAKADWGRAINEGLNQYFSQLPQYYQQVRANRLQEEKIAQQQQLFDMKMQEAERTKKARESWPETVASLPLSDPAKKYLASLPYEQGVTQLNTIMSQYFKPKTRLLSAKELEQTGFPKGTQQEPSGKYVFPTKSTLEYFDKGAGIDEITRFKNQYSGPDNSYSNVVSISQLPGSKIEEKQLNALQLLPPSNPIHQATKKEFAFESIKQGQTYTFIPEIGKGGVNPQSAIGGQANTPDVTDYEVQPGDDISSIVENFRSQGFPVSAELLFALNPEHFEEGKDGKPDINKLKTFEQTETFLKVTEAKDGVKLSPDQINNIQNEGGKTGTFSIPGYGTIITNKTLSAEQFGKWNEKYNNAKVFVESIEDLLTSIIQPGAQDVAGLTANAGKIQALHRRIMRIQQTLSNMGVLSPGEIPFLLKSVPDYRSFTNWLFKTAGRKEFIDKVYQVLRKGASAEMKFAEEYLNKYGEKPIIAPNASTIADFEIPQISLEQKGKRAGLE